MSSNLFRRHWQPGPATGCKPMVCVNKAALYTLYMEQTYHHTVYSVRNMASITLYGTNMECITVYGTNMECITVYGTIMECITVYSVYVTDMACITTYM